MDDSKYGIFISHRLEDRKIAKAVSGALRLLGGGKLIPFVCDDIPGGREWRDWIDEKIEISDIMLFLYTQESSDWRWCFYEIGLFRGPNHPEPRPIICIRNPSIKSLPSPLEKYQAYEATEEDILKFFKELLYKGEYTNKVRLNDFSDDSYLLAIQDFLSAFKASKIEKNFYVRRGVFNLKDLDRMETDGVEISSDSYTMEEIFSSPGQFISWQNLYEKFKAKGQSTWLDEVKESIESIKKGSSPICIMKPFKARGNKKYIPILTRVEQMPFEGATPTIPKKISLIFIPCSDIEEECGLIDMSYASDPKYLLDVWKTILPTSVIRVKWKRKSNPIRYSNEDMIDSPVVYAINPAFADLYNFNYGEFPDPDGDTPLTSNGLLRLIEEFIVDSETYIPKIVEDQAEISQKIIFEGSNAIARVPLKLNDKHPIYPNSSYLPCLVSKSTAGDVNGPHLTYLAVIYVRGDWAV